MDQSEAVELANLVAARGITRLCHLTPFRNLVHILAEGAGLLSLEELARSEGIPFNRQDAGRFDGRPNHISASIEYPNAYYMRNVRQGSPGLAALFPHWVCLALDPAILARPGTEVSPVNAAAGHGAHLEPMSVAAFERLFDPETAGTRGRRFTRTQTHLRSCPTDAQAEVMLLRSVPHSDIKSAIVPDRVTAKVLSVVAEQFQLRDVMPPIVVAPTLFDAPALRRAIERGNPPSEVVWTPDDRQ